MEHKKTTKADLQNKRPIFISVGLTLSLTLMLVAFEWKTHDSGTLVDLGSLDSEFEDMIEIPPTIQPQPKPPVIQQPKLIVVEDDEVIEEIDFEVDIDITEDQIIDDIVFDDEVPEETAPDIFLIVEDQAAFPGGPAAWKKFLEKNLKYPRKASRMGVGGKVFLSFVVDKAGNISDIKVTRGIGGGCDEEAIRVLSKSPKWSPGRQRGNAVKSRMGILINFTLK